MTPNKLVEAQKNMENHNGEKRENMVMEGKVKAFLKHLDDEGKATGTQHMAYSAIVSFFKPNQYPLRLTPQNRPSSKGVGSRIPEKEEVRRILDSCRSQKHHTIVMFLKDSGLKISEDVRLKWSDMKPMRDGRYAFGLFQTKIARHNSYPILVIDRCRDYEEPEDQGHKIYGFNFKNSNQKTRFVPKNRSELGKTEVESVFRHLMIIRDEPANR